VLNCRAVSVKIKQTIKALISVIDNCVYEIEVRLV
jgi:hypothetical protein